MEVLCVNAGSSSLRVAGFRMGTGEARETFRGSVARIGSAAGALRVSDEDGDPWREERGSWPDHAAALEALLAGPLASYVPDALGHRVVHGGASQTAPALLTPALREILATLVPLAPLHLPANLAVADATLARFPAVPQVACFDTAFHARMPETARRLAIPRCWDGAGVRRYGFHGLSCEHVVDLLAPAAAVRTIIAHLGAGASATALRGDRSIWNSMGFTPCGGLPGGTRSGDLDPGLLLYWLRSGLDADALEALVNTESGLHGIAGHHGDMGELLALRQQDERAALAVELFAQRVRMEIGALAALLGGLDQLVFTGGIGQGSPLIRSMICDGLDHLGIVLSATANAAGDWRIDAPHARTPVWVLVADENRVIARHVHDYLARR